MLTVDAQLDVSAEAVQGVLADYRRLAQFSGAIIDSQVRLLTDARAEVDTTSHVCVWLFCKTMHQVQIVSREASGGFLALVDPDRSDFKYGRVTASVIADGGNSRLLLRSELQPDFWIPPMLGPWLVRTALTRESREGVLGIERIAQQQSS